MRNLYMNRRAAEMLLAVTKYRGTAPDVVRLMRKDGERVYCLTWIWKDAESFLTGMLDADEKAAYWEEEEPFTGKYWLTKPYMLDAIFKGMRVAEKAACVAKKTSEMAGMLGEFAVWFGKESARMVKEDVVNTVKAIAKTAVRAWSFGTRLARAVKRFTITWAEMRMKTVEESVTEAVRFAKAAGRVTGTALKWTAAYATEKANERARRAGRKAAAHARITIQAMRDGGKTIAMTAAEKAKTIAMTTAEKAKSWMKDARSAARNSASEGWTAFKKALARFASEAKTNVATIMAVENIFH